MTPQPPNQPPTNPRLAQYQAQGAQPMGMSAVPMGGAPTPQPNFRGMGAPPNQMGMPPQSQIAGARMPAPWMQNQQSPTSAPAPNANPSDTGPVPGAIGSPNSVNAAPQSNARMPAPWNRPQAQGQGMSPASRMQSQGPQRMGQPANGGMGGASMKSNAEPDQNKMY